jgi:hypothetical protein
MVRLAFADMLLMWLFQLKSELNVTPRYLRSLVTSSSCDVDSGVPQGTVLGPVVPHIHH